MKVKVQDYVKKSYGIGERWVRFFDVDSRPWPFGSLLSRSFSVENVRVLHQMDYSLNDYCDVPLFRAFEFLLFREALDIFDQLFFMRRARNNSTQESTV